MTNQNEMRQKPTVSLKTSSGDAESVALEPIGRNGDYFLASLPSVPGPVAPGDGVLQSVGGTTVTVEYEDENTEATLALIRALV